MNHVHGLTFLSAAATVLGGRQLCGDSRPQRRWGSNLTSTTASNSTVVRPSREKLRVFVRLSLACRVHKPPRATWTLWVPAVILVGAKDWSSWHAARAAGVRDATGVFAIRQHCCSSFAPDSFVLGSPKAPGLRCQVEEHVQTSKVIVFKKKRRKGERGTSACTCQRARWDVRAAREPTHVRCCVMRPARRVRPQPGPPAEPDDAARGGGRLRPCAHQPASRSRVTASTIKPLPR